MSKIKLTNSVQLDFASLAVAVDTSNLIASVQSPKGGSISWTATSDCYVGFQWSSTTWGKVDDIGFGDSLVLVRQGTVIYGSAAHDQRPIYIKAFGFK